MRRFHTAAPWFGEPRAVLCEEVHVQVPSVGERIILSGGRVVRIQSMGAPKQHRDGYRGKIYWTATIEIEMEA